eukprot:2064605-Pyramimonas_sp.AAC.1
MTNSGLGGLLCLKVDVYGRRGSRPLAPRLAREGESLGLHPGVRAGAARELIYKWWGLLGASLHEAVGNA